MCLQSCSQTSCCKHEGNVNPGAVGSRIQKVYDSSVKNACANGECFAKRTRVLHTVGSLYEIPVPARSQLFLPWRLLETHVSKSEILCSTNPFVSIVSISRSILDQRYIYSLLNLVAPFLCILDPRTDLSFVRFRESPLLCEKIPRLPVVQTFCRDACIPQDGKLSIGLSRCYASQLAR